MKPKVTFTTSGNSYPLNAPASNTITTNAYPPQLHTQTFNTVIPAENRVNFGNAGGNVNIVRTGTFAPVAPPPPIYRATTGNMNQQVGFTTTNTYNTTTINPGYARTEVRTVPQTFVREEVRQVVPVYTPPPPAVTTSSVQRVERVEKSAVVQAPVAVTTNEVIEEYERPHYQRLYTNTRTDERRLADEKVEPTRPRKCCGPLLWALLGLLGLAGLILGLLFGLGVIGGHGGGGSGNIVTPDSNGTLIDGVNYNNNSVIIETQILNTTNTTVQPVIPIIPIEPVKPPVVPVIPIIPIVPSVNNTVTNPDTSFMFPPGANTTINITSGGGSETTTTIVEPVTVSPIPVTPVNPNWVEPIVAQPISTNTTTSQPVTITQPIIVDPIAVNPIPDSTNQVYYTTAPNTTAPISVFPQNSTTVSTTITSSNPISVAPIPATQPTSTIPEPMVEPVIYTAPTSTSSIPSQPIQPISVNPVPSSSTAEDVVNYNHQVTSVSKE